MGSWYISATLISSFTWRDRRASGDATRIRADAALIPYVALLPNRTCLHEALPYRARQQFLSASDLLSVAVHGYNLCAHKKETQRARAFPVLHHLSYVSFPAI